MRAQGLDLHMEIQIAIHDVDLRDPLARASENEHGQLFGNLDR